MEWNPTQFFQPSRPSTPYAILVLNQPVNQNAWDILKRHACYTICADGGANHFYEMMKKRDTVSLPDAIVGDLDSIWPEVRAHYENLNVTVVEDPCQYSTDFTKCLQHISSNKKDIIASTHPENQRSDVVSVSSSSLGTASQKDARGDLDFDCDCGLDVVVLGGLGGRVDQAFSQVHHLHMFSHFFTPDKGSSAGGLYLVSEESISFILQTGHNTIFTPGGSKLGPSANHALREPNASRTSASPDPCLAENIGIIPISGPTVITTTGLEWDVKDWTTEFGGQLSTSNHIRDDVVTVETSGPVMFTTELPDRLKFSGCRRR